MNTYDPAIQVTDSHCIDLLRRLEKPLRMGSLPNPLSFLQFLRENGKSVICFVGPARCGKTTTIRNLRLTISATEIFDRLQEAEWMSLLCGELTVQVEPKGSSQRIPLKYLPLENPAARCAKLATALTTSTIFHYEFKDAHTLDQICEVIVHETMRVAHVVAYNYPDTDSDKRLLQLMKLMKNDITGSIAILFTSFPKIYKKYSLIFIDDYDVPFCNGTIAHEDFERIKQTISNFVSRSNPYGRVCLFGSLSFPALCITSLEGNIFTMKKPGVRFLGIPTSIAEAYLIAIGKPDVNLKNYSGMSSEISHDVHPMCFHKTIDEPTSFFAIEHEYKSYYFILEVLRNSPATYELVSTLYTTGWYPCNPLIEAYSDESLLDAHMLRNIPVEGCIKVLESLGFIKRYEKRTDIDKDCLEQLGKDKKNLDSEYYSFTNISLYYSFTFFLKKISHGRTDTITAIPFINLNIPEIIKLCREILNKFAGYNFNEVEFVKQVFYMLLNIFPAFLVVREFVLEDNCGLDLGLFSFVNKTNAYIFEVKLSDNDLSSIVNKDIEAIHQVYCKKYYTFMQKIDATLQGEKLKARLDRLYIITYITDAATYAYTSIRKFNEKLKCNCQKAAENCQTIYRNNPYPTLDTDYFNLPEPRRQGELKRVKLAK